MEHLYGINQLGALIEIIVAGIGNDPAGFANAEEDFSDSLKQLFLGPDSIFTGEVLILDANIFKTIPIDEYNSLIMSFSSLEAGVETISTVANPRI